LTNYKKNFHRGLHIASIENRIMGGGKETTFDIVCF